MYNWNQNSAKMNFMWYLCVCVFRERNLIGNINPNRHRTRLRETFCLDHNAETFRKTLRGETTGTEKIHILIYLSIIGTKDYHAEAGICRFMTKNISSDITIISGILDMLMFPIQLQSFANENNTTSVWIVQVRLETFWGSVDYSPNSLRFPSKSQTSYLAPDRKSLTQMFWITLSFKLY